MTYNDALALIQAEIVANGNNEITANVLRPVLEAMIDFPNDVIGALSDLDTSDVSSIVNAINSIVSTNLPNATALRPIDTTGVDFNQDELLWVRDAINNTATNNGAFTCSLGQQMVFYCDVLISIDGLEAVYQTRYYRLTTGAIIVNSLGTGLNPPLMPDGSTINTFELNSDLVIDLGNIGTDDVEDAFNSDGDQPFTIIGDKFIQAIQNGDNKLWQWIGGDGTFGNSATLALASYFVDLTSTTPPPSSIPKYEQIKGGAIYQSLTATPSIALNLNSFFYRYIVTDDDLEITFSNLPAPDYGFPRFIDLVIPATKVLTIPSANEIVGTVIADGTTVNRIELRFVYYPTVGLRIVAVVNGGASSGGVESVTGDSVDNTDPLNPVVNAVNSTTVGEPSGSDEVDNIVTLTQAEYDAGTPVAGTVYIITDPKEDIVYPIFFSDQVTVITTGSAKMTFPMPFAMTVTSVRANLKTADNALFTIDINENGTSILSTKLTIDSGETSSLTATTPAVISDPNLANDSVMTIDVDTAGTAAVGGSIILIGKTV